MPAARAFVSVEGFDYSTTRRERRVSPRVQGSREQLGFKVKRIADRFLMRL